MVVKSQGWMSSGGLQRGELGTLVGPSGLPQLGEELRKGTAVRKWETIKNSGPQKSGKEWRFQRQDVRIKF